MERSVFSDEKRFNLDGPCGYSYYWRDLSKPDNQLKFSTRKYGGGGLLFWGAFSATKKVELVEVPTTLNSERYIETIDNALFKTKRSWVHSKLIFQQDNASCHVSKETKSYLKKKKKITLLDWPAQSPDLNPIENLWGIISRKIYSAGKQYENREELREAVLEAWDLIILETMEQLIQSMKQRCIKVIENKGEKTNY